MRVFVASKRRSGGNYFDAPKRLDAPGEAMWCDGAAKVTIKLGVVVLAGPDNGGTYQYTLSMLQALRHVDGL